MGIFKKEKSKSESKSSAGLIKNLAPSDFLFWQYPQNVFKINSQLVVMPGEQALFVKKGNIDYVFDNGTYYLNTQSYNFIKNYADGAVKNFSCSVIFFRKASSIEILWGTDSPIQVRDKVLGISTTIKARGAYKVYVDNVGVFLEKLAGSRVNYLNQEDIKDYFANEFLSKIKSTIVTAINNSDAELLGIEARLDELSQSVLSQLNNSITNYGLICNNFSISAIDIDDSDLRRKYDEIGMAGLAKIRNAQADKAVMDTLGNNWGRQQSADLLNKTAGSMSGNVYVGSNPYSDLTKQFAAPDTDSASKDDIQKLIELKSMLDAGLITDADYEAKKKEILGRM